MTRPATPNPALTPVHLKASEICGFLVAQGLAAAPGGDRKLPLAVGLTIGQELPAQPNRIYAITPYGGVGYQLEQAVNLQSFQVRTRGKSAVGSQLSVASDDAQEMAWIVDGLLTTLTAGLIGERLVTSVTRTGSPPQFLLRDKANRVHLTCNYQFVVNQAPDPA